MIGLKKLLRKKVIKLKPLLERIDFQDTASQIVKSY